MPEFWTRRYSPQALHDSHDCPVLAGRHVAPATRPEKDRLDPCRHCAPEAVTP